MFLFGEKVHGGVIGGNPDLKNLLDGDLRVDRHRMIEVRLCRDARRPVEDAEDVVDLDRLDGLRRQR